MSKKIKRILILIAALPVAAFFEWSAYEVGWTVAHIETDYWKCPEQCRLKGFPPGINKKADEEREWDFKAYLKAVIEEMDKREANDPCFGVELVKKDE